MYALRFPYNNLKESINQELTASRVKRNNIVNKINALVKDYYESKNQKDILENNLMNDSKLPFAVKNVLNKGGLCQHPSS